MVQLILLYQIRLPSLIWPTATSKIIQRKHFTIAKTLKDVGEMWQALLLTVIALPCQKVWWLTGQPFLSLHQMIIRQPRRLRAMRSLKCQMLQLMISVRMVTVWLVFQVLLTLWRSLIRTIKTMLKRSLWRRMLAISGQVLLPCQKV